TPTRNEVITFAETLRSDLYESIEDIDCENLEPVYDVLVANLISNAPASVKEIFNTPSFSQANTIIKAIEADIALAFPEEEEDDTELPPVEGSPGGGGGGATPPPVTPPTTTPGGGIETSPDT